ncbi:MAG: cation-transporting P-type ATPase, partial [ANME-2 cluster archaeon]
MRIQTLEVEDVYEKLNTSSEGLDEHTAASRLQEFGENTIVHHKQKSLLYKLLNQFIHFFAILLWIAAALSFVGNYFQPGEGFDLLGFAIISVIFINALFTFVQEYRAEKAAQALQNLLPHIVNVTRSGTDLQIDSKLLVPGDVIKLGEGDRSSADARIVEQFELRVNNSALTGESEARKRS